MILLKYWNVLELNSRRHRKARPLTVFQAHHTQICSSPQTVFLDHRQPHDGDTLEVQIAVPAINSIGANRCRGPDFSIWTGSECIDIVASQSFTPRYGRSFFVAKT